MTMFHFFITYLASFQDLSAGGTRLPAFFRQTRSNISIDIRTTSCANRSSLRYLRYYEMKDLQGRSARRLDGRCLGGAEVNAGALFDVVILIVEPDITLAFHEVDELVLVGGIRLERLSRFEPAQRTTHVARLAQRLVQHLGDLALASRCLFGQLVGIDECERHNRFPMLSE